MISLTETANSSYSNNISLISSSSDVATTIFYIVTHNGVVLDMRDHYLLSLKAHEYIRPRLSNTAQFNRAYSMVDYSSQTYYVQEFLYRLRFEKQIAFGDFEKLEDALENALRISWTGNDHFSPFLNYLKTLSSVQIRKISVVQWNCFFFFLN